MKHMHEGHAADSGHKAVTNSNLNAALALLDQAISILDSEHCNVAAAHADAAREETIRAIASLF